MKARISESLVAEGGKTCCAFCGYALAPSGTCGHLLDTETALPEDPFLEDVVTV
jgi:hypothetical protein